MFFFLFLTMVLSFVILFSHNALTMINIGSFTSNFKITYKNNSMGVLTFHIFEMSNICNSVINMLTLFNILRLL